MMCISCADGLLYVRVIVVDVPARWLGGFGVGARLTNETESLKPDSGLCWIPC
jgi:hypothetical protein